MGRVHHSSRAVINFAHKGTERNIPPGGRGAARAPECSVAVAAREREKLRAAKRAAYSHMKKRAPDRPRRRRAGCSCRREGRAALELERTATGRRAASLKPPSRGPISQASCRLAFLSARGDRRPGAPGRFGRVLATLIGGLQR
jgi:hypothetical protein